MGNEFSKKVYQNCSNTRSVVGSIQSPIKAEIALESILCDSRGRGMKSRFSRGWRAVCTGSDCLESAQHCAENRRSAIAQKVGNDIDISGYPHMSQIETEQVPCQPSSQIENSACHRIDDMSSNWLRAVELTTPSQIETEQVACRSQNENRNSQIENSNSCLKQLFQTLVSNACLKRLFQTCV